jgi:hypothetical protein
MTTTTRPKHFKLPHELTSLSSNDQTLLDIGLGEFTNTSHQLLGLRAASVLSQDGNVWVWFMGSGSKRRYQFGVAQGGGTEFTCGLLIHVQSDVSAGARTDINAYMHDKHANIRWEACDCV